jgi:hypothetical protein
MNHRWNIYKYETSKSGLCTLATDAAGKLHVLGHDGHTLGMNGAQVGVLKQANKIGLSSLLQGTDSRTLEAQISLEVLCNLAHKTLEGELADQQLSGLLEATNLTQSNSSGAVAVGLLDSALCQCSKCSQVNTKS